MNRINCRPTGHFYARFIMSAFIVFLTFASPLLAGTPELLFEAGNRAYLDGDWRGAIDKWKQVESAGYYSGELYFNLGNAYYKAGESGDAILNWERAARLLGEDRDLAANLAIARSHLTDKLEEPVRLPVWNLLDGLRARFANAALGWIAIVVSFLLFLALGLKRWVWRGATIRSGLRWVAVAAALVLVFDLSLLGLRARDDLSRRAGVLIASEAEVLSAPAEGSGKLLFTLHEGAKVRVHRELQGWYEISVGKDKQGWVKKEAMGII